MKTIDFVALTVEKSAQYIEDVMGLVSDARSTELRVALAKVVTRYVESCTNETLAAAQCQTNAIVEAEQRAAAATKAGAH